jgi:hypothetical protein
LNKESYDKIRAETKDIAMISRNPYTKTITVKDINGKDKALKGVIYVKKKKIPLDEVVWDTKNGTYSYNGTEIPSEYTKLIDEYSKAMQQYIDLRFKEGDTTKVKNLDDMFLPAKDIISNYISIGDENAYYKKYKKIIDYKLKSSELEGGKSKKKRKKWEDLSDDEKKEYILNEILDDTPEIENLLFKIYRKRGNEKAKQLLKKYFGWREEEFDKVKPVNPMNKGKTIK